MFSRTLFVSVFSLLACDGVGGSSGGSDSPSGGGHPLVGSPAPTFSLDSSNKTARLDVGALKGKVVVVDFWATWCGPCKESFPKLQALYSKFKGSGVEVLGVSEDDDGTGIAEFAVAHSAKFPLGWDKDKSVAGKWDPKTMPTTFIVDRNGVVRFAHLGYHQGDEAEMEKEIKGLL